MGCNECRDQLDAYLDGELTSSEAGAISAHLRSCLNCAADTLEKVQVKRSVAAAGKRYEPSSELRKRIAKSVGAKRQPETGSLWKILAVPALVVVIISMAVNLYVRRENGRRQQIYSELADLHVAALASTSPVDIVSTDRHTVKPWFQGKIPFTFNLPELQNSEFTLLGGRMSYVAQTPGAQLIYQVRKHEISVFIFQDRGEDTAGLPSGPLHTLSFNVENWTQNGLRYFVIGDVGAGDIEALSKLLRGAG
jgi:anti-sigma factor RsiW